MRDLALFGFFFEMQSEFEFEEVVWFGEKEEMIAWKMREGEKVGEKIICGGEKRVII